MNSLRVGERGIANQPAFGMMAPALTLVHYCFVKLADHSAETGERHTKDGSSAVCCHNYKYVPIGLRFQAPEAVDGLTAPKISVSIECFVDTRSLRQINVISRRFTNAASRC